MKKKNTSLGCFFWLAFILLIALLFFINKDNIARVFKNTDAISIFQKKEVKDEKEHEVDLEGIQNEIEKIRAAENTGRESEEKTQTADDKPVPQKTSDENKPKNEIEQKKEEKKTPSQPQKEKKTKKDNVKHSAPDEKIREKEEPKHEQKKAEKRSSKIYLVKIESDGKLVRKAVMRELVKTDSPLTDAINSLLQGPTTAEAKQGFRSFIPPDTKLLSIEVKNGVAEINISEDFQFNRYGIEAYQAQLAQIVFTACEFSTVSSVQFLIKGKKKEYLGAEGIWIGSPLSVNSFSL
ncbi:MULTISPECIES: GerMN domain-containing protein [unclassified Treponema]|uniref:GerMN domain-containing protein n=1 Tax=unclassified Treponema TaxID=2638727 RepID=UPI0020A44406|nr:MULTISPECIES: GerMN domain-containing protein [unclassified Treponema]UTC67697.1 GerMN domain-containing protein [Treponema sp. OMZ 789]UTC70425.1 GerMN domain-containing protein [Treponema sp. OMZ 790]UTC73138.1 GerMN domain-containing protein [Treponema sp. OMZ 791]